jgi:hypothetical protein
MLDLVHSPGDQRDIEPYMLNGDNMINCPLEAYQNGTSLAKDSDVCRYTASHFSVTVVGHRRGISPAKQTLHSLGQQQPQGQHQCNNYCSLQASLIK